MANAPGTQATLDLPALESWLWKAACIIRGPVDAPKFKDYILPLIFVRRLSARLCLPESAGGKA